MFDTIYDALSIVFILLAIVLHVFMIAAVINMFFLKGRKMTVMVERYSSNDVNMDAEEEQNQMRASHAHAHVSLAKRQMKRVDEEQNRR